MAAVMNTFALFEQFRTVLGEERAKDFAETIGKMIEDAKNSATKEDIRLLRESADANTSRLEAALARLAEAQARTEAKLEQLVEIVTIEPVLGAVAVDDFLRADVVATGILQAGSRDPLPAGSRDPLPAGLRGTPDGSLTYLVGEISFTADENDVMRAARRTACFVKAGLPAIGLVACERIAPQTAEYARKEGVRVWLDGRVLDADSPPESPAA